MFDYRFRKEFIIGQPIGLALIAILIHIIFSLSIAFWAHRKGYSFGHVFLFAILSTPLRTFSSIYDLPNLNKENKQSDEKYLYTAHKLGLLFAKAKYKLIDFFGIPYKEPKNKTPSFYLNQEYLRWTYDHFLNSSADEIKLAFPGGKAQMSEIIIEILSFCGHDPDDCTWQTYMRAIRVYLVITEGLDDPQGTADLLNSSYSDIIKDPADTSVLIEHFSRIVDT